MSFYFGSEYVFHFFLLVLISVLLSDGRRGWVLRRPGHLLISSFGKRVHVHTHDLSVPCRFLSEDTVVTRTNRSSQISISYEFSDMTPDFLSRDSWVTFKNSDRPNTTSTRGGSYGRLVGRPRLLSSPF